MVEHVLVNVLERLRFGLADEMPVGRTDDAEVEVAAGGVRRAVAARRGALEDLGTCGDDFAGRKGRGGGGCGWRFAVQRGSVRRRRSVGRWSSVAELRGFDGRLDESEVGRWSWPLLLKSWGSTHGKRSRRRRRRRERLWWVDGMLAVGLDGDERPGRSGDGRKASRDRLRLPACSSRVLFCGVEAEICKLLAPGWSVRRISSELKSTFDV